MRILMLIGIFFYSCGGDDPGGGDDSGPETAAYTEIKPIIKRECGRCHNGSNQQAFNEKRFNNSQAQVRIKNESMPPDKKLAAADKQALLNYFAAK